ncbi:MAG: PstS family phosphate ABC transporter substrate-binding protein [Gemmatimonadales bacterium]
MRKNTWLAGVALVTLAACGGERGGSGTSTIAIDGSSTVFPITMAVAEEFQRQHQEVRVTVGISGTGGGFKKFTAGETDINDASRPIKGSEIERAGENGIDYIEIPVAFDGLSVVVNRENTWVDYLAVQELHEIWRPSSTVRRWSDVRASFPDRPITLYGPGTDSGTFDYFTEVINGESGACRSDFTASEDDNVLVQGVAGDPNALAFFGFAYYVENRDRLRVVPIDPGDGPVAPSDVTIKDGRYRPLSRPIFIYVRSDAAKRPEVQAFIRFYLENAPALVTEVGYVPLPDRVYELALDRFEKRVTGSVFQGETTGKSLEELLGT